MKRKNRNKRIDLRFFLLFVTLFSFRIESKIRVILSSDTNKEYVQFWKPVAHAWKNVIGVTPTLAFIADDSVQIDKTLGDVIRFTPLEGISTAFQAQTIRLLIPVLFPDDICIISDIDMIPLVGAYFDRSIRTAQKGTFVVMRARWRDNGTFMRFPMCYNIAKGALFGEIFNVSSLKDIKDRMREWWKLQLGWGTDEKMLLRYLTSWNGYNTKCLRLMQYHSYKRVHRIISKEIISDIKRRRYIDCHAPRPYDKHRKKVDEILNIITRQSKQRASKKKNNEKKSL